MATAAEARGISVYLEFHGGTLTASTASALALLDAVCAPNVFTAWQPPYWAVQSVDADRADLSAIGRRLGHLHVYQWDPDGTRHPLAMGADSWPSRLATITSSDADDRWRFPRRAALLEFVVDDDPAAVAVDAATLRGWLDGLEEEPR